MTYFPETWFPSWKLTITTFFTLLISNLHLLNLEFFGELYFLPYLFIAVLVFVVAGGLSL